MNIEMLIFLIPLPPLFAFAVIIFLSGQRRALSHWLAIAAVALSWVASMVVFITAIGRPDLAAKPLTSQVNWLPMADQVFKAGVLIDPLSAVVLFFVAWTILMIFIYSIAYHNYGAPVGAEDKPGLPPQGAVVGHDAAHTHRVPSVEPLYTRFFAFASLFAFGMLVLVVTDNLLVLYMAWEIMGLCSYLLIGFWFARPSARDAAIKAFLTTRIGDMFMLLGMAALYSLTGSLNYQQILGNPQVLEKLSMAASPLAGLSWSALIGLLIFAGTVGKSAQFPLHVWLPDAMEGPTPVSAMIHAATMVSAGVYLVIRFYPLLAAGQLEGAGQTPPMIAMTWVGAFTALFAASIALAQSDVKRVLAYSTISQLGFMIAALGVGAYVAAVFHLVMHAFFKALLFLGSGSVIHGMQHGALHTNDDVDPQNMFVMGGLLKKMPFTSFAFVAGGLSLAGFPYVTAGFWSKDEILAGAFGGGYLVVFAVLALAAFLTAFYTMRQITLVFGGSPRSQAASHASETSPVMWVPLLILSFFAIAAGWSSVWFKDFVATMLVEVPHEHESMVPLMTSLLVSLSGLFLGWWTYRRYGAAQTDPLKGVLGAFYDLLRDKYRIDELYQVVFIRPARWVSRVLVSLWVDRKFLDGILYGLAHLGLIVGKFLRQVVDLPVFNRGFEAVFGRSPLMFGHELRRIQTGRVQQYIIFSLMVVLLVTLVTLGITYPLPTW